MAGSTDIANEAIQLIGDNQPTIVSAAPNWDDSAAGKALRAVYASVVATVGRQFGWDMARSRVVLAQSGNIPPAPWSYEYLYPTNGIQIWQLSPPSPDPNNPLPVNWSVGNVLVNSVQTKVIWTNQALAQAVYNNNPSEAVWDPLFRQSVVRLLASELAMALAGKPDTSQTQLEVGGAFTSLAETRDS
jgi:hypothetical protein